MQTLREASLFKIPSIFVTDSFSYVLKTTYIRYIRNYVCCLLATYINVRLLFYALNTASTLSYALYVYLQFLEYVQMRHPHVTRKALVDCVNDKCASFRRKLQL